MNSGLVPEASIIKALREKGYRATSQRIAISRLALSNRDHPTARRIYGEIRRDNPTVSLATVYKTLQVLRELGLVQQLTFPEDEARFDSRMKPHLNLICQKCGNVTDAEDRSAQEIVNAANRARFVVTGQRIDVYGICQRCGRRNNAVRRGL
jgi:Fur family peroxide stress response transcriptional regulator